MNRKLLSTALLLGLGLAHAANAQEFDDRWYLTGSVGYNIQDDDRRTSNAPMIAIGVGKFLTPKWSLDGQFNYQNPSFDSNVANAPKDLNWPQYGFSLDIRRHFLAEGRDWNPYGLFGIGYQRAEESYPIPSPDSPGKRKNGDLAAKIGLGLQGTIGSRATVRAEVAVRVTADDHSIAASSGRDCDNCYPHKMSESYFTDTLVSVGVILPLGAKPVNDPPPPPPPPPPP